MSTIQDLKLARSEKVQKMMAIVVDFDNAVRTINKNSHTHVVKKIKDIDTEAILESAVALNDLKGQYMSLDIEVKSIDLDLN